MKQIMPFVSIVVLNYNGKDLTPKCIESLKKIEYPKNKYEIIVADNNSEDNSIKEIRKKFPKIKIIELYKNYGYAKGNNLVVKYCKGDYIVFLNQDIIVDKNWLKELMKKALSKKEIKVVGSKNVDKKTNDINTIGGYFTLTGGGTVEKNLKGVELGYACGSSILIEKKLFEELGGFDEEYFMYNEEVDFCWRAWLMGHKVVLAEEAVVFRNKDDDEEKRRKFLFHIIKNQLQTAIKNFEGHNLVISLIITTLYNALEMLRYTIHLDFKSVKKIIHANIFVLKNLKKIIKKRKWIQKRRKIKDKDLFQKKLFISLIEGIKKEVKYWKY